MNGAIPDSWTVLPREVRFEAESYEWVYGFQRLVDRFIEKTGGSLYMGPLYGPMKRPADDGMLSPTEIVTLARDAEVEVVGFKQRGRRVVVVVRNL